MSTHNIRAFDLPKAVISVCGLIAIVAAVACIGRGGDGDSEGNLDEYFLRDVATVEAMGLPVYWLGTEFTVDGLVFRGPYGAEFGGEVQGGGIRAGYLAPLDGGNVAFRVTTYSRDAWELVEDRTLNPRTPGASHRTVSVLGKDAEMFSTPGGARPLNALWLVLDLGDVVVVASTNSGIGSADQGSPELNPLIKNPDLLIQVMEDLRPYPE